MLTSERRSEGGRQGGRGGAGKGCQRQAPLRGVCVWGGALDLGERQGRGCSEHPGEQRPPGADQIHWPQA